MIDTIIVGRRIGRLGLSSLWLLIGLGLILLLAGCAAGSSGTGGNGPASCSVNTASADCDEDGVINGEDEFPTDASRSCTVTDGNSTPGTTADCDNDGHVNDMDNCPTVANSDQTNTDDDDEGGDACDINDDNDAHLDTVDVDDDNDGLIEIATAADLNNVRHNLMGTDYKTSASASGDTTGAPAIEPIACEDGDSGTTRTLCGYELSNDIDLTSIANWQPIGASDSAPFQATFDGNDFRVSNMVIDTSTGERIGLFGSVGVSSETLTIRNLHVSGSIVYRGTAAAQIGGLIGRFNASSNSMLDGCSSAVAIIGGSSTNQFIGGLIGNTSAAVENSWATGAVHSCGGNTVDSNSCAPDGCTCAGGGSIGGLVGSGNGPITNSYATGAVRGNGVGFNQGVGGFAGVTNSSIADTYATGAVVGGDGADAIGGLTGRVIGASASRSYATGTVDDGDDADNDPTTPEDDDTADNIGGLVGLVGGPINDSYYSGEVGTITDGDVSDTGDLESLALDAAVIPRRTPEILRATSTNDGIYSAWSADNWDFGSNSQFPALKDTEGELLCGQPAPRVQCSS